MIVREPDNLCVICGAQIPEGRQVCPICDTKDEAETFTQFIRRKIPKEEDPLATAARDIALKIKAEYEQAFNQGYNEGYEQGRAKAQDEINRLREYIARQSEEEYD